MRQYFIIIAITCLFISCQSKGGENKTEAATENTQQSDEKTIASLLDRFKTYTEKGDFVKLMDYMAPDVVKGVSKEEFVETLEEGLHNENYDILIRNVNFDSTSKIVRKNSNKYVRAFSTTKATFVLKKQALYDSFCSDLKMEYENVSCDEKARSVTFDMDGESYVVYSQEHKKWFVVSDTDPKGIRKYIPADVREELGIVIEEEDE